MKTTFLLTLFLGSTGIIAAATITLQAKFSMIGISGHVEFTQTDPSSATTIMLSLSGMTNAIQYDWEIREFPTNWDTVDLCKDSDLGSQLTDLSTSLGRISHSQQDSATFNSNAVKLSGLDSIEGRSLLLKIATNPAVCACATIQSTSSNIKSAVVRLPGPVAGTVIFRQSATGADTSIYTDLMFTDGSTLETATTEWGIRSNRVLADLTQEESMATRCNNVGDVLNSGGISTESSCSTSVQGSCKNGNLIGKHGNLSVGVEGGATKKFFIDTNLDIDDLSEKSLVVTVSGKTACANIQIITPKTVMTKFGMGGVMGMIRFTQNSPWDPVETMINITGLNNSASGYHVHEFPIPSHVKMHQQLCSGGAVGGHLNPFSFDKSTSPAAGIGTNDEYEVGDLSGKYGTLAGKDSAEHMYTDWNLQLFGLNSIVGRSFVIHKNDPAGSRWVCANIGYSGDVKVAVATFKYPVIGQVWMRQISDDPLADTSIFAMFGYNTGLTTTTNHNLHVHIKKMGSDMMADSGRCQSVTGHYNPYSANVNGNYSSQCNAVYPLRCELGDLTGKGGTFDIGGSDGTWKKTFYTDVDLPLSGPQSIIGRSLTIHDANKGAGRLACADIYEHHLISAVAQTWSTAISGSIKFSQDGAFDWTKMAIDVNGLSNEAGGYHIHVLPTEDGMSQPCSNAVVGGHFNPYQVVAADSPAPGTGSADEYELGDLSGKFGRLTTMVTYDNNYVDNNLPLMGPQSIMGRSVVIHKEVQNARWSCANIVPDFAAMSTSPTELKATMTIDNGEVEGYVKLMQIVFSDGSMSDTTIEIDIKYKDSERKTDGHKWHVHELPVGSDGTAATGRCSSTKGHLNPFHTDVTAATGYSTSCSIDNPYRCELGDMSGKQALYSIGGGKKIFTDVDLPLAGQYSVVGRSIVLHDADEGAGRFACADILPDDAEVYTDFMFPKTDKYSKTDLVNTLATALITDKWNIAVAPSTSQAVKSDCMQVNVLLSGSSKTNLKTTLGQLVRADSASLEQYQPTAQCGGHSAANLIHMSGLWLLVLTLFHFMK